MFAHDLDHKPLEIIFIDADDLKGKDEREFQLRGIRVVHGV